MSFTTTAEMLNRAQAGGYAVGAFNFENMEMAMAIIAAAEEMNSPVIIQTTPTTVKYAGLDIYYVIAHALAQKAKVPVALHLDHGDSVELAAAAVKAGYSSVMIDGSQNPLDRNIEMTRRVVELSSAAGIPVEAELGHVGGKEDELTGRSGGYTDPADAVEFVRRTSVTSLAVAIGTAHGFYKVTPVLDVARLREIRKHLKAAGLDIPLVLHGASGLSEQAVRECVAEGICKVNFATELREAYTIGVRSTLTDQEVYDPKKYGKAGMAKLKDAVITRMKVCGCVGRA
jgi:tagatose 1,6-diphosphate aldolase GatY/KbaY